MYHIGQLVITQKERNNGYGTLMLQLIKNLSAHDNSNITLECLTSATSFFIKQEIEKSEQQKKKIFADFLDSPLFKKFNDML